MSLFFTPHPRVSSAILGITRHDSGNLPSAPGSGWASWVGLAGQLVAPVWGKPPKGFPATDIWIS